MSGRHAVAIHDPGRIGGDEMSLDAAQNLIDSLRSELRAHRALHLRRHPAWRERESMLLSRISGLSEAIARSYVPDQLTAAAHDVATRHLRAVGVIS